MPDTVDIWVDPCCPWAWLTWCWLAQVERLRDVRVHTRLLALAEVNREAGGHKPAHDRARPGLRVLVAARRAGGEAALGRVYEALTEAYQERGEELDSSAVLAAAVAAAGLDPSLVATALEDPTTEGELVAEHAAAAAVGAFGVPTLHLAGGAPFFGPVLQRRLAGRDAAELWDHLVWLLRQPELFELKRTRTGRADVGRLRAGAAQAR